jgi:L-threonylcarbamoyladenylate synthase
VTVRPLSAEDARALEAVVARGGVAVFPTDTVYGVCCDPENEAAVRRLNALKRRPEGQAAAVLFFSLDAALAALPELAPRTREAARELLPGPVTLVLPNAARRYPLASAAHPTTLGVRVPRLAETLRTLQELSAPLLQSSANIAGAAEARRLRDVAPAIIDEVDLALDGGELPGVASTVLDLSSYERTGAWTVLREGALARADIDRALRC